MTRDETKKLVMTISAAFPNYKPDVPMSIVIDLWATQLEDCPYEVAMKALSDYIRSDTKGFAPSVGQIVSAISAQAHKNDLSDAEAWALVSRAASKAGYYAEEEFNKLPLLVQKAIGNAQALKEYAMMDLDEFQTVQKSLFQRTYRGLIEQERNMEKTGSGLVRLVKTAQDELYELPSEGGYSAYLSR